MTMEKMMSSENVGCFGTTLVVLCYVATAIYLYQSISSVRSSLDRIATALEVSSKKEVQR